MPSYTYNRLHKTYTFTSPTNVEYNIPLDYMMNTPIAKLKVIISEILQEEVDERFIQSLFLMNI